MGKSNGLTGKIAWVKQLYLFGILLWVLPGCLSSVPSESKDTRVRTGAEVLLYEKLSLLQGKRVGLVTNHTARVGEMHLADTLMRLGVNLQKIFAPEHGFRGEAEAGAPIRDGVDTQTGLPVVSLYGNKKQPSEADLEGIDIVLFDIQDVGARFYTYLSTMVYCMDACAQVNKPFWVLDRPNPNGWYVGGPVLEKEQTSFVGLHTVPVVHGMTLGEYARMVNEEGWLPENRKCRLEVIPVKGYRHSMKWEDTGLEWVPPSPNLPSVTSALYYPILCWYEGTPVSVGRGTIHPFTVAGAPWHVAFKRRVLTDEQEGTSVFRVFNLPFKSVAFTPKSLPGKANQPLYESSVCYGVMALENPASGDSLWLAGLQLLQSFYLEYKEQTGKQDFFQPFFHRLSGDPVLSQQIIQGKSPDEIFASWQKSTRAFWVTRKKYLMYPER